MRDSDQNTNLSNEINLIRKTAESLLAFKYECRSSEEWFKFWGCLDTLRDMDVAIFELLNMQRKPSMVECIGFLQVLVSQQDAIHHLLKTVGLHWKPTDNEALEEIRDLRNRVTAHSAWSDRGRGGSSTSMINQYNVREGGFEAVLYRQIDSEDFTLCKDVNFFTFVKKNVSNLSPQIRPLLDKMNMIELSKKDELKKLDWKFLDNTGDDYLIEKLWFPWEENNAKLWQAVNHMKRFSERLSQTKIFFEKNKIHEIDKYSLSALIAGAQRLTVYLSKNSPDSDEELEYYIMLTGWTNLWREFDESMVELKDRIGVSET